MLAVEHPVIRCMTNTHAGWLTSCILVSAPVKHPYQCKQMPLSRLHSSLVSRIQPYKSSFKGVARIFLVVTLSYIVIYVIYGQPCTNYLFISSAAAGMHLTKFSPIFAPFHKKYLKKFLRPGGGGAPALPPSPGYAYKQLNDEA